MKKVGLVVNREKDDQYRHTAFIAEKLLERGFEVIVSPEVGESAGLKATRSDSVFEDSDLIICVGGDGTFLKAVRKAYLHKKPVLGINKGSVGFLAEVETRDIEWAIEKIARGEIKIVPRMVLDVEVIRNGKKIYSDIAINDAVVSRTALSRILRLRVTMDDQYVDSFPGDGVIVSTPTGSTGYTLSAGGPIIQPDMRMMVISPICPHILYSRSFIVSDSRIIKVGIDDNGEVSAMLTLDGQEGFELLRGDLVHVKASGNDALFASVCQVNFYDVLRSKIHSKTE